MMSLSLSRTSARRAPRSILISALIGTGAGRACCAWLGPIAFLENLEKYPGGCGTRTRTLFRCLEAYPR
jgi:hypothetical protein